MPATTKDYDLTTPAQPLQPVYFNPAHMGMVTSVGADAPLVAAAVKAGVSNLAASSVYNKQFNPMTMSLVPEDALPPLADALQPIRLTARQARLLRLAGLALKQCLLTSNINTPLPLFLAGPEVLPGFTSSIPDNFLSHLAEQAGEPLDVTNSKVVAMGRAGGFYVLQQAMHYMQQNNCEHVLLGGVDSYLDLMLLGELDKDNRVMSDGVMDGFFPGEGAAVLLLSRNLQGAGVVIHSPNLDKEPGHRYSEQPYKGDGLSSAIAGAIVNAGVKNINSVWASFNGENFGAKEWGVAAMRNQEFFPDDLAMAHPADCFGDIGAAFGPVMLGLAAKGLQKNYVKAPSLVWCSSEAAVRSAVCLNKVERV